MLCDWNSPLGELAYRLSSRVPCGPKSGSAQRCPPGAYLMGRRRSRFDYMKTPYPACRARSRGQRGGPFLPKPWRGPSRRPWLPRVLVRGIWSGTMPDCGRCLNGVCPTVFTIVCSHGIWDCLLVNKSRQFSGKSMETLEHIVRAANGRFPNERDASMRECRTNRTSCLNCMRRTHA